jgi:hypothetical protein
MIAQQLNTDVGKALRLPSTSPVSSSLPEPGANQFPKVNSSKTGFEWIDAAVGVPAGEDLIKVSTVATMKALTGLVDGALVQVMGYSVAGDGGGGEYIYDADDATSAPEGDRVIASNTAGVFKRQIEYARVIDRYQVQPNKTIASPNGDRFIAKGVQMFDYLFVSFEARTDYKYRTILSPPGKGPGTGISEPTYFARISYISRSNVDSQILAAKNIGANMLRVGVEHAVMLASVPYVDPTDMLTYPSDEEMLDVIVNSAEKYGMVIQLQSSRDEVTAADNITLLRWLAKKYRNRPHVWINPANEINGVANGGADVNNATVWAAEMRQYVLALREDKFLNPVAIDPPGYATRIDLVNTTLSTDVAFTLDPNLIVNIHVYQAAGEDDFVSDQLPTSQSQWVDYIDNYCVLIGEFGIDNQAGRFDPNLDQGTPSVDLTEWGKMQSFATSFALWASEQIQYTQLNGCIGHMWFAYIPGLLLHDDNSMRRQDGTFSTWGNIYRGYFLSPPKTVLEARRALGAQFSTGAWQTGDVADDAITQPKVNLDWSSYTPSITSGTGALTTVSSVTGRFLELGKLVFVNVSFTITTNGTGATSLVVGLPPVANVAQQSALSGIVRTNGWSMFVQATAGTQSATCKLYDSTYPGADGRSFAITGMYEVV